MRAARAFAGVSRVPFLLLPIALAATGAAASAYDGGVDLVRTLVAAAGLLALHVAVNALNEAHDARTGIDERTERTPFSGGSGTIVGGLIGIRAAHAYGLGMAAIGLAIGGWFLLQGGWPLLVLVAVGAAILFSYTPLLLRVGLGEPCAGLGLGGIPVLGISLIQDHALGRTAWLVAGVATLMTFNLLLLNEFPDEAADRAGGRRHLVILLGRRGAGWVYVAAALLVALLIAGGAAAGGLPPLALVALAPLALLAPVARWFHKDPARPVPRSAMAMNVAWNLATHALLAIALAASAG